MALMLLDTYGLVYRAFFALPGLTTSNGQPINAVYGFTMMLNKLIAEEKPTHVVAAFDKGTAVERVKLFAEYKAQRRTMPDELRSQFALVSQDVVLFNDTIRNNIAFNAVDKTQAQVEAAARAANVMEFVAEQPQGFDTPLADRGQNLSGGQRQRISIARALLKDSPILILDEATAALDNESERRVQHELGVLMQGRTTLVIAHRLSTVEGADRIIVLDQGRIVESGTHQDLLARGGLYAALRGTLVNA